MSGTPRATVIVCTHDRGAILRRALEPLLAQAATADAETLVVDNASTDETPAILAALGEEVGPRLRTVREARLGLSAARNRGLADARGEIAVFVDDDATPRPGWLGALIAPYADPHIACVGGRVALAFDARPPAWLTPALHSALSAYDAGSAPIAVRYGKTTYPFGANISFRVAAARAVGGFSETVGPRGRHQLVHDETDLCYRLEHAGHLVWYTPDAVVDHHIEPNRVTPQALLRRHWTGGQSAAVFILRNRGLMRAVWRLWWLYRDALTALPYDTREPIDPDRFTRECRRREALGYVTGLVRALPRLAELRRDMAA